MAVRCCFQGSGSLFFGVGGVQKKKKIYFEFQHLCLCVVRQVPTRDLPLQSASLLLIQSFILIFNIVKIASVMNDSF